MTYSTGARADGKQRQNTQKRLKKSLFCVKKDGMNYCDIKDISGFFNELIYIKSQSKKAFSATTPFANANLKAVSIV